MYAIINQTSEISSRLAEGTNSNVELVDGQVVKMPEDPQDVEWEVRILQQLEDKGFQYSPKLYDYNDTTITMSLINSAGTLYDYIKLYGSNPKAHLQDMKAIWSSVQETVEEFHELGFVHGALHSRNIVMEYNEGEWQAYLIDFSSTYHEEDREEFCHLNYLIEEELYDSDYDWEFLEEYIIDNWGGNPAVIHQVI